VDWSKWIQDTVNELLLTLARIARDLERLAEVAEAEQRAH
jgi:hypothetical protein